MKPNISIGDAVEKPEEIGRVNPSTAEEQPAEAIVHLFVPARITQPAKRNIFLVASVFAFSICTPAAEDPKKGDSTGRNAPSRDSKPPTYTDQSERPEERRLTQAIREAVMKDQSLSMMAKTVTIITANNRVTLSGSVKSTRERININNLARAAAGEIPVDNQLEVKAAK